MQRSRLFPGAVVAALVATGACSREEARQDAREAASDARAAAARAGDQLADSWLTTKIQAQYFADEDIKARHINVSTRDGAVVLTGYVDDQRARQQAVQIARNTDGVAAVDDRLIVGRAAGDVFGSGDHRDTNAPAAEAASSPAIESGTPGALPTTGTASGGMPAVVAVDDEAITSRIQAKYFLDDSIKPRTIDVVARDGVVTLNGEVASESERAQALILARTTEGVQRVEDGLTVDASLAGGAVSPASPEPVPPDAPPPGSHDAPPEP